MKFSGVSHGRLWLALALCLAGAGRAAAVDWTQAQTVTVTAVEYAFQPNRLDFKLGVAYRLHLVNRGKELHELTAPAFFKTIEIHNPEALNPEHTELVVQPGEAKDLDFVPKEAGHFPFWCADHDWAGMTGEIVVN
ncbi:MAG TPA: cupredoxin domain-containing protein [Stellaceae bacterium]|nr:cupredoxin domain-containing protein [Stellaceae bacterium]